jgi:hypothetical protein
MRRRDGIIELRRHTGGGPAVFGFAMHNAWGQAWQEIGDDPDNEVLILTGTGDSWLTADRTNSSTAPGNSPGRSCTAHERPGGSPTRSHSVPGSDGSSTTSASASPTRCSACPPTASRNRGQHSSRLAECAYDDKHYQNQENHGE